MNKMRDLTQKEIDNAPERFDAYYEDGHGNLRLLNTATTETCSVKWLPDTGAVISFDRNHYSLKTCKPIPRKQEAFDIGKHEFSDEDIGIVEHEKYKTGEYIYFQFNHEIEELRFCRDDIIALAKVVNLTADDLK